MSEARVTPEHSPLFWCARALAEEIFAYSLAVVCCGPVNHQLRNIIYHRSVFVCVLPLPNPLPLFRPSGCCAQEQEKLLSGTSRLLQSVWLMS